MTGMTRRDFIRISALTAGALAVSFGVAGCSDSHDNGEDTTGRRFSFDHGVASGDPLSDSVILWTRVTTQDDAPVTLHWEIARDEAFTQITHSGQMSVTADHDFTGKVDARHLLPDTIYYYRFRAAGVYSPTGRSRTLPLSAERVSLAAVSCSNYPAGYFHAYNAIANLVDERDLNALIHLGDYLYEYGAGGYATADAEALGRSLSPDNDTELLTLTDYRRRYALYRTDPDLQQLHARLPWIVVWDDHEITNDAWQFGAENHNEGEGEYATRKMQALQAWFEWLPIRPAAPDNDEIIYRSFRFADLVALHMLDTRIIGRDEQLEYANYIGADGTLDGAALQAALTAQDRELLGSQQQQWLTGALADSLSARWQVLGQQVLMARMTLPIELLLQLRAFLGGAIDSAALEATLQELSVLKQRRLAGETLSITEQTRLDRVAPYNLDAWDGYPVARERVLALFRRFDRYPVVLAGDTHNAWVSQLTLADTTPAGVEFAVNSVTSPGFEAYLADIDSGRLAQAMALLIDDLKWADLSQRGFMVVTFDRAHASCQWHFIDTIKARDYTVTAGPTWQVSAERPGSLVQVTS